MHEGFEPPLNLECLSGVLAAGDLRARLDLVDCDCGQGEGCLWICSKPVKDAFMGPLFAQFGDYVGVEQERQRSTGSRLLSPPREGICRSN